MSMDKEISADVKRRRKKILIIKLVCAGCAVVVFFVFLVKAFSAAVSLKDIDLGTVTKGEIGISVSATGKVASLSEEIITSPISSKILEVYKKSGEKLLKNDSILKLDLAEANVGMENQQDELEMKRFKLEQMKIVSESQLSEMKMSIDIDEMKLERMKVLLQNEKYLDSIGASTSDKIKQAELEYKVQKMNLDQLKLKYDNQKRTSAADIRVQELDYNIALKNISLRTKMMKEAQVRSPQDATLIWVNDQVGATVPAGSQLAIVADLTCFKIEAEITDGYADKVSPGNKAVVRVGNEELSGIVGNVVPSIKDGMIEFIVFLDDNDHERLRSGLKVDVFVINAVRDDALRLERRSFYNGPGDYNLWVVDDDHIIKKTVKLGEGSYDYVEVLDGLKIGDKVVVSDMNKYRDNDNLKIRR